ncbi:MAG: enoyl-CoA hydratase/isomerase family protein [Rhizobiaceae bacterium]|nr:enoyl-CoA hydratase/isomerase family protein [Rhizobiaceae bacterium]
MADELLAETRGSALRLTLNRPERHNALNLAMTDALVAALASASADPAIRAVVLTGAGDRTFCSGADLKEGARMFRSEDGSNPIGNVLRAIQGCGKPVIARVNGSALAGGFGLVAACDLAYAADHVRFGLPEIRVGIFPMMIATRLLRQVPERRLREMAYLGETIGAAEAERWNVVNGVAPAGALDGMVEAVLDKLRLGAPRAMAAGKQALFALGDLALEPALLHAERTIAALAESDEASEGRAAFAEKRKPAWAAIRASAE